MAEYIDLSHKIHHGLITYQGLPAPIICDFWSRSESRNFYEDGSEFQIAKIEMVSNTGTYIDCPFHRFENGDDLSELDLINMSDLPVMLFNHDYHKEGLEIQLDKYRNEDIREKAILINTGWSEHWNTTTYFSNHPFLGVKASNWLRDNEVKLVGIDSYNIDDTRNKTRPIHTTLLGSNILIVEHLCNLNQLKSNKDYVFSAVPPKIEGIGSFPVRAYVKEL